MKKTFFTLTMALCLVAVALGASSIAKNSNSRTALDSIEGYIVDKNCSSNKAMWTNESCVAKCLKGGDVAVLVTEEGRVYRLDQAGQEKAVAFAGKKVEVTGSVSGDSISVTSIK